MPYSPIVDETIPVWIMQPHPDLTFPSFKMTLCHRDCPSRAFRLFSVSMTPRRHHQASLRRLRIGMMGAAFSACLTVAPNAGAAEGWANFFEAIPLISGVVVYGLARAWMYWLMAGAVLAWILREPLRAASESLDRSVRNGSRNVSKLVWLLPSLHWHLTALACVAVAVVGVGNMSGLSELKNKPSRGIPKPYVASAEERARYAAMIPKVSEDLSWREHSPLKQPWPADEGYLPGFDGSSSVGVKEVAIFKPGSGNSFLIKLCWAGEDPCTPLRLVYLLNQQRFSMRGIAYGNYELRVLNLKTGLAWQSKAFSVRKKPPAKLAAAFEIDTGLKGAAAQIASTDF